MKLIVVVACVYLLESQVRGAVDVSASDYFWVANFDFDGAPPPDNATFCTGSLIRQTPPVILTAAHCFDDFHWDGGSLYSLYSGDAVDLSIVLGGTLTLSLDEHSDIVIHGDYGDDFIRDNDLALVMLAINDDLMRRTISVPALPAQLPEDTACCTNDDAFTVLGYDFYVASLGTSDPDQLQRDTLNYITEDACKSKFSKWGVKIDNDLMCTLSDGCTGESGEPVIQGADAEGSYLVLAGVSSFEADHYCRAGTASAATSLAQYRTWIETQITSYDENGPLHDSRNTRLVKLLQAHGYNGRVILMLVKENPFKVIFFIVGLMVVLCGMVFKHKNGCRLKMGKDFAAYERIPDSDEEAV